MTKDRHGVQGEDLQAEFYDSPFGRVSLYKDPNLDWYKCLAASFSGLNQKRTLNSKLLYFGPHLAESWVRRSRTKTAPGDMRAAFETAVSQSILPNLSKNGVTLIDLGVGEFSKGHIILDRLLRRHNNPINYVLYDVSYDMLISVLKTDVAVFKATLEAIHNRGEVIAINADFYELDVYRDVLPQTAQKCFGMFGNTLGTQDDQKRLLGCIGNAMSDDDVFIAELQLLEPVPPTDVQLLERFAVSKDFYAGPFLALGYRESELKLEARTEYFNNYATVNVTCRVMKTRTVRIKALRGLELTIPEGEYCTLKIYKYEREAIEQLFDQSGFEIVDYYRTPSADPSHRIFAHIAAHKRLPSN